LVAKNRGPQLNQAKILRIYPIVLKKKNQFKLNLKKKQIEKENNMLIEKGNRMLT
jgi:hypothetical protein